MVVDDEAGYGFGVGDPALPEAEDADDKKEDCGEDVAGGEAFHENCMTYHLSSSPLFQFQKSSPKSAM